LSKKEREWAKKLKEMMERNDEVMRQVKLASFYVDHKGQWCLKENSE
jgi:hypothetical protein